MTDLDLAELRKLAKMATPGPWTRGDHWHIQGASHCRCSESYGPLVEVRRMNINGKMMDAHVHELPEPFWNHGIYTRNRDGSGYPRLVVNDTQEYGYMTEWDADYIAAASPVVTLALLDEIERLRGENARLLANRYGPYRCCVHCADDPRYHAENPKDSHEMSCTLCDEVDRARACDLEDRLSKLLYELTDGRMSGTGYDVPTMVHEVEAAFERAAQADTDEAWSAVVEAHKERDDAHARVAAILARGLRDEEDNA